MVYQSLARRRTVGSLLTLVLAITAVCVSARPADALVDAACAGTETNTFRPGLTNTVQPVENTIVGSLGCVSLTDPAIRSATTRFQVTADRSCTSLLNVADVALTLTWNTGERSVLALTVVPSYAAGQLVNPGAGTVSAGKFRGSLVTGTVTLLGDFTRCATPGGLTTLAGPWTVQILL